MFTINHRAAALAAVAALFATGATAQVSTGGVGVDAGATGGISFSGSDRDADGSISKEEASGTKELTGQFDKLDANRDGKLDQGEFAKFEASGSAKGQAKGSGDSSDKSKKDKKTPDVQNEPKD